MKLYTTVTTNRYIRTTPMVIPWQELVHHVELNNDDDYDDNDDDDDDNDNNNNII